MLRSRISNLLLPNVVLPVVDRFSGNKAWSYLREYLEADYEDPAVRQRRQWRKMKRLLEHAYRNTIYYRQLMDSAGLPPDKINTPGDLRRLPVTTKQDLRNAFPDNLLASNVNLDLARISNTSGTLGRPMVLVQDSDDINWKYASKIRTRHMMGCEIGDRVLRLAPRECQPCLSDGTSPDVTLTQLIKMKLEKHPDFNQASFIYMERGLINRFVHQRTFPPPLEPNFLETGLERYLKLLKKTKPEVLAGHPMYLYLLARMVERRGEKIHGIKAIDCTGDLSTAALRAYFSEQFNAPVFQIYGGCEWGRLSGSCSESGGTMHMVDDLCYVEFLSPEGEPTEEGELSNLIVTSLTNYAMPLIRFEHGDVGWYTDSPCSCGRTTRRLDVEGRLQGLIIRHGEAIPSSAFMERFMPLRGVMLFQVSQLAEDRFELCYLPDKEDPADEEVLRAEMAAVLGEDAEIQISENYIVKTAPSGKYRLAQSKSFAAFRCVSPEKKEADLGEYW